MAGKIFWNLSYWSISNHLVNFYLLEFWWFVIWFLVVNRISSVCDLLSILIKVSSDTSLRLATKMWITNVCSAMLWMTPHSDKLQDKVYYGGTTQYSKSFDFVWLLIEIIMEIILHRLCVFIKLEHFLFRTSIDLRNFQSFVMSYNIFDCSWLTIMKPSVMVFVQTAASKENKNIQTNAAYVFRNSLQTFLVYTLILSLIVGEVWCFCQC